MFNIYPLAPNYTLQVCSSFEPPPAVRARVDEIWAEEKKKRGNRLTNGRVYSLVDHRVACLRIQPAEYRHVLAGRRAPELADAGFGIRPLAVTGILVCADGLVLGRRSDHVCPDAGLWEAAPAGGLSRPDPAGQLLEELREEVGLEPSQVILRDASGLVVDVGSGVIDIVFRLDSTASAGEIRNTHAARATNEYSELAIVPEPKIAGFLEANEAHVLPALRPMLSLAGLL